MPNAFWSVTIIWDVSKFQSGTPVVPEVAEKIPLIK